MLTWLTGRWRRGEPRAALEPLWQAVVARGRSPRLYRDAAVPDTIDGRFDAITAVLAVVLIRLEAEPAGAPGAALLTECFVEDMDAQMREIGIGDLVVGKQVGKLMALLGGRLGAYREALRGEGAPGGAADALSTALRRNLYRGAPVSDDAVAHAADELRSLHGALAAMPVAAVLAGRLA